MYTHTHTHTVEYYSAIKRIKVCYLQKNMNELTGYYA